VALNGQQWDDFTFVSQAGFDAGTYVLIDATDLTGALGAVTSGSITKGASVYPATLSVDDIGKNLVLTVLPAPGRTLIMVR
jgi:hypothetical protein